MIIPRKILRIVSVVAALLAGGLTSQAATYTWTTAAGGTWDTTATNWSSANATWVSPGANLALFDTSLTSGSTVTVSGNVYLFSGKSITANQTMTLASLDASSGITFGNATASTVAVANGKTLTINANLNAPTGSGGVYFNGPGTIQLGGNNTFTAGQVHIGENANATVEQIGGVITSAPGEGMSIGYVLGSANSTASYTLSSGNLSLTGSLRVGNLRNGASITGTATGTMTVNGSGVLLQASTITLGNDGNTSNVGRADGTLELKQGTVQVNVIDHVTSGAGGKSSATLKLGGATGTAVLQGNVNSTLPIGSLTAGADVPITLMGNNVTIKSTRAVGTSITTSVYNAIGESGGSYGLTFDGVTGSIAKLYAANTYSGETNIKGNSTLQLMHANALQTSTLNYTVANTGTVVFDSTVAGNAFTFGGLSGDKNLALTNNATAAIALTIGANTASYSGNLTGSGSLIKNGSGTQTLSGANAYTGTTTVSVGTLLIGNTVGSSASLASGSTVSVSASGTLGGYGTIGGATTITDGNLAPGASSAGSLKFGGSLSLVASAGTPQTQIELGGTSFTLNTTEQYDRIKLTGATPTLTLAGTLSVSLINSFSLADNQAFGIFQLNSGATRSGTFSGLASDGSLVGTFGGKNLYITYSADFGDSGAVVLTGGNDIALYTVPEPSTWALLASGLAMFTIFLRRRAKRDASPAAVLSP